MLAKAKRGKPPPYYGTLKVEIPCNRAFRGKATSALTNVTNQLHPSSPTRKVLERLNESLSTAPWVAKAKVGQ